MSWKASAWAKSQRLGSPAAKGILLCLADYADPEKSECWPSQQQLADDAEVSERTVRDWLQRLESWGLICRKRRARTSGARSSDLIVLCLGTVVTDGADRIVAEKEASTTGDSDLLEGLPAETAGRAYRQPAAEPTGNHCRAYKEEPSIEPPNVVDAGARASGFDDWWAAYPNKVGKADARRAFERARRKATLADLIAGLRRYIDHKPPDRPWCNPATWLNGERWLDEPARTIAPTQPRSTGGARASRSTPDPLFALCGDLLADASGLNSDENQTVSALVSREVSPAARRGGHA